MVRVPALLLTLVATMTVAATPGEQDVVSASTLKRAYTVNPTWPESAVGIEGWVRLQFTLLPDGTIADIQVKESHPAGVFDASAMDALRQWKYEPVEKNGKKVAQRAEINMKYAQPR